MGTMLDYTIYCTPEQVLKALELGAPIGNGHYYDKICIINTIDYATPTAEEMIGWLEDQGFKFRIYEKFENSWFYYVGHRTRREPINEFDNLTSRKEATIATIDVALEYLTNNKK